MGEDLLWSKDKKSADRFTSSIKYQSRHLKLIIDNDGEPFDAGLSMMQNAIKALETLDSQAKQVISHDLRDTYNDSWREYDELQADGSYQTISNPELSEAAFKDHFELEHLEVMGGNCVTLWYGVSDLFAGHSIFVQSFNGIDFSDASAEMFG